MIIKLNENEMRSLVRSAINKVKLNEIEEKRERLPFTSNFAVQFKTDKGIPFFMIARFIEEMDYFELKQTEHKILMWDVAMPKGYEEYEIDAEQFVKKNFNRLEQSMISAYEEENGPLDPYDEEEDDLYDDEDDFYDEEEEEEMTDAEKEAYYGELKHDQRKEDQANESDYYE